MNYQKKFLTGILFAAGLALCLTPLAGNVRSQRKQEVILATYENREEKLDDSALQEERRLAEAYNQWIYRTREGTGIAETQGTGGIPEYSELLNTAGTGMMGSLEIPGIDVDLPVYHGTEPEVLAAGAGHLEGSSLPVGGAGTRCVLTGHRGLPGSRLFTRLDELERGDLIFLRVLRQVLAYEVREIEVIDPEQVERLEIREGQDLVSLVTCTPYGINTERLVVTGIRVPYDPRQYEEIRPGIPSCRELIFSALPFLFSGTAAGIWIRRYRKNRKRKEEQIDVR